MNMKEFEDETKHPMSRRRLAAFYFPDKSIEEAVRILRRWINESEIVKRELEIVGYKPRSREIFPPAIEILLKWFGNPFIPFY